MVGRRIDGGLAARAGEAHVAFQRVDHLHPIDRSRLLHRSSPQVEPVVGHHREFGQWRGLLAEALVIALDELGVGRRLHLLEVRIRSQDAVMLLRVGHHVLVAHPEGGRRHRDLLLHARGRPLPIERDVRPADEHRHDDVRLGRLDLLDGRPEVGHVQREEVGLHDGATVVLGVFLHPLRGDLAIVVVGREYVDLLAVELLHRIRNQLFDRLRGRGAGAEAVAVAHATFILRVVEIQRVEALEHRPDRLARSRGDARVHHRHLLLGGRFGGVLRVVLDVRLRIVVDQLQLPPQQPAGGVGFFHRQREHVDHRPTVDVQPAGGIVDAGDLDVVGRVQVADEPWPGGSSGADGGGFENASAVQLGIHELSSRFMELRVLRKPAARCAASPLTRPTPNRRTPDRHHRDVLPQRCLARRAHSGVMPVKRWGPSKDVHARRASERRAGEDSGRWSRARRGSRCRASPRPRLLPNARTGQHRR